MLLTSFLNRFNLFAIYSYALLKYNQIIAIERVFKFFIMIEDYLKNNLPSMRLHAFNVAYWTIEIAKKLNLPKDEREKLYYAALFHDIGKINVKNSIVNKEGPLTPEEYEEIKEHAEFGYVITRELFDNIYPDIPFWIKWHHENYDGSGYPEGLKKNEIPFPSRILRVANVIDVLHSPKSYKKPVTVKELVEELKRCTGKDFDPDVVDAALDVINERIVLPMDILKSNVEKIFPALLSLRTFRDVYNFNGYFVFNEKRSYFKSTDLNGNSVKDLWDLQSASLVVEIFNSMYEYEVEVIPVEEHTYIISNIRPMEKKNFISILWELEAELIAASGKSLNVKVKRLSGDYLLFAHDNSCPLDMSSLYKMKIKFEDGEELILNGIITYYYNASTNYAFYKYAFVNIGETTRDKLFKQIFKKQIYLRSFLKKDRWIKNKAG
ncbi:HD domain protein [Carboxydothermus hydrogenoformans Z-2901]|uniref:HD domain protein n=1 Tax=Carboxydothermus hydrogenoformans (strain ATCC BAA-161 / DSM 6008 / Z-2901) TaxID=246194 RepID=Q3ADQ1_CARHZ|nr:HD domain protein [Carboxydothermus hydrogenoformans Z-2901]